MESWTVSARKLDSCWNSDCARSQRMLLSASALGARGRATRAAPRRSRSPPPGAPRCPSPRKRGSRSPRLPTPTRGWALAWMETNRSARCLLAKLVRSRSGTNTSVDRVSATLTPSRLSSTIRATRLVTSSTTSFSVRPLGPVAPGSWPPCPASSTIELQRRGDRAPARPRDRAAPSADRCRSRRGTDRGARSPSPRPRRRRASPAASPRRPPPRAGAP